MLTSNSGLFRLLDKVVAPNPFIITYRLAFDDVAAFDDVTAFDDVMGQEIIDICIFQKLG